MKGMFQWERLPQKAAELFQKYKYVLLVIAAGIVLLLLPLGREENPASGGTESQNENGEETFRVEEMERRLEEALSRVDGAGEVTVVLTVKSGARQILAQDSSRSGEESSTSTVVISTGSGTEDAVVLQQVYPQYQGALVVCPGGGDPAVCLKLVDAVSALTGLGADKISICKSK
ncbi:stage III sporulation protein AG [Pseudoflavonifractor capillosus]|uniref:stage III sporulation protein AG n=1 Tax=Pseudoflavonifractor capillosus TaxID=106588 RepID=UPI002A8063E2|nr:stage III sporulation protein AG [Pseudoflavonifractor capillosus]MDY4661326.1 stage III sporulation protein AG [Pseudoflavonifractor capillosus]